MMTVLLLLLATQFPSANDTSWMEPASFRLLIGESREHVESAFERRGWKLEEGENENSLLHPYGETKSVVLEFRDDYLVSIRFELVSFHPQLPLDWDELKARLRKRFGEPEVDRSQLLVQATEAFTIHAVLQDSADSELGRSGAGMIIVRYFVPASSDKGFDTSR